MKYNDVFYKDQYVSLVLKEEGKTDDDVYADILDTNGDFITYISKEYVGETIDELKQCKTDLEICQYLIESGIVDNYFKIPKDESIDDDLREYIYENYGNILTDVNGNKVNTTKDLDNKNLIIYTNSLLSQDDYINKIGNYYVRCA